MPWSAQQLADAILPAVREAARAKGYAIAVHGSLARDIDLIAVPWVEDAAPAVEVAEAIRAAAAGASPIGVAFPAPHEDGIWFQLGCPGHKPHGRLAFTFHLGGGPYIDLAVMPVLPDRRDVDREIFNRENPE